MDRKDWLGALGAIGAGLALKNSGLGSRWMGALKDMGATDNAGDDKKYTFSVPQTPLPYGQEPAQPTYFPMTPAAPSTTPQQQQATNTYDRDMARLALLQSMQGSQNQPGGFYGAAQQMADAYRNKLLMQKFLK